MHGCVCLHTVIPSILRVPHIWGCMCGHALSCAFKQTCLGACTPRWALPHLPQRFLLPFAFQVVFVEQCLACSRLKTAVRAVKAWGLREEFPDVEQVRWGAESVCRGD